MAFFIRIVPTAVTGPAPLSVEAQVGVMEDGPIVQVAWQARLVGSGVWQTRGITTTQIPIFRFLFDPAGEWEFQATATDSLSNTATSNTGLAHAL